MGLVCRVIGGVRVMTAVKQGDSGPGVLGHWRG